MSIGSLGMELLPANVRGVVGRNGARRASWAVVGSLVFATLVLPMPTAQADPDVQRGLASERPSDGTIHAVDGVVYSVAQVGGSVVLGGTFTEVGPGQRGAAGVVDLAQRRFGSGFPDVVGAVLSAVPDGAGGWFVGGDFTAVGGQPRGNLARVDASGGVTSWAPQANGVVRSLALGGGTLYAAGDFSTAGGASASRLAAFDASSGALTWGGTVTGGVVQRIALSVDGSRLYLGGTFTKIGTVDRRRLGAVVSTDGAVDTAFAPGPANATVTALAVDGPSLWIGGDFTTLNGVTRQHLAKVDAATGALNPLAVAVNARVNAITPSPSGTVYLGGTFATVGGSTRPRLAGINATTGAVTSLTLPVLTGSVTAVELDGPSALTLGGNFTLLPERSAPTVLARIDTVTRVVTPLTHYAATPRSLARQPRTGTSSVLALARVNGLLFVGGDFSDYGTTTRRHLAKYDLSTGALDLGFDPAPDGEEIYTVKGSADGSSIFVGGAFAVIGGVARRNLAKLAVADGSVDPLFAPTLDSFVKDLAVRPDGTAVYAGGNFDVVNGVAAHKLAAFHPQTGQQVAGFDVPLTDPTNDVSEGGARALALSPDSTRLMVIGNFRRAAGLERPLIAQIDVGHSPATVTSWRTSVYDQGCARGRAGWMRDVDISPDGSTAYVVSSGHFYYPACDTVNAFPMVSLSGEAQRIWSTKIGDTIETVAATGTAVYIGGHFRYVETETRTQARFQIASLDPTDGSALNWNPNAGGFLGVKTIESEPAGLFVGSDGDYVGKLPHGRFAFFPNPAAGIDLRKHTTTPWLPAPGGTVTFTLTARNTFSDRPLTLTGLQDSRLGSLNGVGTCSLPQTIAAGASYSCTVSDSVSGAALTQVAATATATATDGATTLTDTDTSTVDFITSPSTLRMRVGYTPWTVAFPQGTVRFSVTLMNLDLSRPLTVTSLTSPTFGSLAAHCGLPVTVAPNRLHACHLDLPVSGDVGARPSFTFTATGTNSVGSYSSNGSASVTITPPPSGTPVLFVVGNPALLTGSEAKLIARLQSSYAVTVVDDNALTAAMATDQSVVVLGGSVAESAVGVLKSVTTPVLVSRNRMLDELGMAAIADQGQVDATAMSITTSVHPLATAYAGTVTVNTVPKTLFWARPGLSARTVAVAAPGQPVLFAYAGGAQLADGSTASACRVYWSASMATSWTAAALAVFDRATAYAASGCGRNMLWTAIGNGSSTWAGEGAQSTASGLSQPYGLAISPAGELYIADQGLHAIRKLTAAGTLVTVAGTGTAGYSGDNGPATSARLNAPVRIAFDSAGNLFIADSANNRIRKVNPSGTITTVVGTGASGSSGDGGPATSAALRTPYDVFAAADGSLFIADKGNHKVRKVSPTGTISTVAGTGTAGYNGDGISATSARLSAPSSVAVDSDGTLYIADYDNERVRTVRQGVIDTFAGTGVPSASGDGGPATEAGLHKPVHVRLMPNGDLVVCEVNNNRVRRIHDGLIETLAGTGQFGYVGDGGPPIYSTWQRPAATVLDSTGTLWVADRNNRRIRVINAG